MFRYSLWYTLCRVISFVGGGMECSIIYLKKKAVGNEHWFPRSVSSLR